MNVSGNGNITIVGSTAPVNITNSVPLPASAQAYQHIEKFGTKGGRAYARKLAALRVQTTAQRALELALWRELNRRGNR